MGRTRTKSRSGGGKDILHSTSAHIKSTSKAKLHTRSIEELLTEAATLLEQSQPELALPLAEEALRRLEAEREHYASVDALLQRSAAGHSTLPEALLVSAETCLAVGDVEKARTLFNQAASIDPDGALTSAEPWLWLAQLCEEGGTRSIAYFTKAVEVLKNEIDVLEDGLDGLQGEVLSQSQEFLDERRSKLADALCAMAEIYMTDLSWDEDAEARCETFVTEAVATCPDRLSAGTLQVLASVRISQERLDEARQALARSMLIWKDLPEGVEDATKPDFATRVSLARLLMEVEAEPEAMFVLEGLTKEDDQSVEALYLGGWCQVVMSQKAGSLDSDQQKHKEQARLWLGNCLKLYQAQQYEDERLQEHALELVSNLNAALGIVEDDEDQWEDDEEADDDDDEDIQVEGTGEEHTVDKDVEMT